jgi:O-acetyl-ADP-ribose deacetylase (regulator of RNase III)
MDAEIAGTMFEVLEADIAALELDVLVNAANDHLWMGSGVAGALRRAGGPDVEREAVAQDPIPVGSAVATTAGRLPARWVIHAAVMGQDLRTSADAITAATTSTLRLADELGARSVGLPAFGTGVGGFPLGECAGLMIAAAVAWTRARAGGSVARVVFVTYGSAATAAFGRALEDARN